MLAQTIILQVECSLGPTGPVRFDFFEAMQVALDSSSGPPHLDPDETGVDLSVGNHDEEQIPQPHQLNDVALGFDNRLTQRANFDARQGTLNRTIDRRA